MLCLKRKNNFQFVYFSKHFSNSCFEYRREYAKQNFYFDFIVWIRMVHKNELVTRDAWVLDSILSKTTRYKWSQEATSIKLQSYEEIIPHKKKRYRTAVKKSITTHNVCNGLWVLYSMWKLLGDLQSFIIYAAHQF